MKLSVLICFFLISATLLAQDNPPTAVCQDITVQLDASGNAVITASDVDGGSTDDMGPPTLTIDNDTFSCTDLGPNIVTLTATDSIGQTDSCTATVTIEDNIPPTATCQDITIQLDASGNASITANDVDNGSGDNCAVAMLSVSPNTFDCSNVGTNNVTLTITDTSGNSSSCVAVVTVDELTQPVTAVCQDITVVLDSNGQFTISDSDLDLSLIHISEPTRPY